MARLKDLEALVRNANLQSPRAPNAKRITKRSFLMFVLPAINLGDFINHPCPPLSTLPPFSPQCSPDLTDQLFGSHTLRSTSGIRCVPCQHLSEPPRRASCWSELNSEEAGGRSRGCSRWWRGALHGWSGIGAEVKSNESFWRKGL